MRGLSDDPALLGQWTITRQDIGQARRRAHRLPDRHQARARASIDGIRASSVKDVRRADYPNMKLQDRDQFTSSIVGTITTLLNVIYGLLAVSIIIALIGIANTLSLSHPRAHPGARAAPGHGHDPQPSCGRRCAGRR